MADLDLISEVTIRSTFEGEGETTSAAKRVGASVDMIVPAFASSRTERKRPGSTG